MHHKFLPLFPLNIVVFPNERLNLHIFEDRYKQLIQECIDEKLTFGIPVYTDKGMGNYGTEMELLDMEKEYDNGELDIRTRGIGIFSITNFHKQVTGKLYAGGEVSMIENIDDYNIAIHQKIVHQLEILYKALNIQKKIEHFTSFDIAHHVGLSLEQEYDLLKLNRESERELYILQHLEKIVPIIIETEKLKERVRMNGHFKQLPPLEF